MVLSANLHQALQAVSNPVLVASEGVAASFAVNFVGCKNRKAAETPAETGCPETGEEFAARVRDEFVLRGPRERTEGEREQPSTKKARSGTELPSEIDRNERLVIRIPARKTLTNENSGSSKNSMTKPAPNDTSDIDEVALPADIPPLDLAQELSGVDIMKEIKGRYLNDLVFSKVVEKPKEHKNFSVEEDLVYIKEAGKTLLCIPEVKIDGRSVCEMVISEGHSVLAHLGTQKTYEYLRDYVWWKTMFKDTESFCDL